MIVDSDPYLAGIYGRKFELDGWEVEVAESLAEGEKKAIKLRPNIIMVDADCAGEIGEEIKRLKAMPVLIRSKLVILAKRGKRTEISEALRDGAADYLLLGHFVPLEAVAKMRKLLKNDIISQELPKT